MKEVYTTKDPVTQKFSMKQAEGQISTEKIITKLMF